MDHGPQAYSSLRFILVSTVKAAPVEEIAATSTEPLNTWKDAELVSFCLKRKSLPIEMIFQFLSLQTAIEKHTDAVACWTILRRYVKAHSRKEKLLVSKYTRIPADTKMMSLNDVSSKSVYHQSLSFIMSVSIDTPYNILFFILIDIC